ncbi:hypothetical protein J1C56_04160 [Aminobacter anthyllidis]|uniref:Uncharacterized protein n=1 Tax=Aminobacter anthyllidis TaxID=1035067 RepID=A0A9X1A7L9_9HYPH|nr:hypothetical protein [Aminobacter anthyllidis]MBT1154778.1 hypothetical protein [Aminobacter anthyllidis]
MPIIATTSEELKDEAARMNELLQGKTVTSINRPKPGVLVVLFEDGTRLFVDQHVDGLEFSITGGR